MSKTTTKTKSSKASRKRGSTKPKAAQRNRGSHGISISVVAQQAGCGERKARRVARSIGLGSGKGQPYGLTKAQAAKLHKALTA